MAISSRLYGLTAGIVTSILATSLATAQPVPPSTSAAPKTMNESAGERRKVLEEEAIQRQKRLEEWDKRTLEAAETRNRKRADCRRQASEQKLHFMKRVRFIRKCMSGGSVQ
jgi:hypothetical protein